MFDATSPSFVHLADQAKLDRSALSIGSLSDESDEKEFWKSKSPYERLIALESMRQIIYGNNPSTVRLQGVLEIAQFPSG